MTEEKAWLIERQAGHGPEWLGICGNTSAPASGVFEWMPSAHNGFRFVCRLDAELFIGALRLLMNKLPHEHTIPSLRSGDERPYASERVFMRTI